VKLGFLYAGQGSQKAGMGRDLYETFPTFRKTVDGLTVDFDLKQVSFTDPEGLLSQTRYTQPCMVAFALGVTAVLREQGIVPSAAAGLSLGEYSALYAAGVLDGQTTLDTVNFRGKAMTAAAEGVESAMIAVLGLERDKLQTACDQASQLGTVVIANDNCPGQLVLGGEKAAVQRAAELAKELGAKRCMPLKVSGPFHTPLMHAAGDALEAYFQNVDFREPEIPVLFNCLGGEKPAETSVAELLVRQVQSGVRMTDCIRAMGTLGLDAILEIGPGKVLSGFVRKTLPEMPVYAVETVADLEKLPEFLEQLGKERVS
jgi:[acyl-carrier-protein] S-malonyltransferase